MALGLIGVIHVTGTYALVQGSRMMTMTPQTGLRSRDELDKMKRFEQELVLGFTDLEKEGTFRPHHDALVVIL